MRFSHCFALFLPSRSTFVHLRGKEKAILYFSRQSDILSKTSFCVCRVSFSINRLGRAHAPPAASGCPQGNPISFCARHGFSFNTTRIPVAQKSVCLPEVLYRALRRYQRFKATYACRHGNSSTHAAGGGAAKPRPANKYPETSSVKLRGCTFIQQSRSYIRS